MWSVIKFGAIAIVVYLAMSNFCLLAGESDVRAPSDQRQSEFAVDLYKKLNQSGSNIVASPTGIYSAIGLVLEGAKADCRKQMLSVMKLPQDTVDVGELLSQFESKIRRLKRDGVEISLVSSVWPQAGYPISRAYQESLQKYFNSSILPLDFEKQPIESAKIINEWVNQNTNGKITNIIVPEQLGPQTKMLTLNAVSFKADWAHGFDPEQTQAAPFFVKPDSSVMWPAMRCVGKFKHYRNSEYQAVELPYVGAELSMTFLVPNETNSLKTLEDNLSPDTFKLLTEQMYITDLELQIPRFDVTNSINLVDTLVRMGMSDAFDSAKADFTGISERKNGGLYISGACQKIRIEVSETGTSAFAATSTSVSDSARSSEPAPVVLKVDRPFIFVVKDSVTGIILFIGRLADPGFTNSL